jgi:hypothetical protein
MIALKSKPPLNAWLAWLHTFVDSRASGDIRSHMTFLHTCMHTGSAHAPAITRPPPRQSSPPPPLDGRPGGGLFVCHRGG